ncbi:SEC-C metal-binding domain-containing protein [Aurantivibrio infirmus]
MGRNDPCPCGSSRRFQTLLYEERRMGWFEPRFLFEMKAKRDK